MSNKFGLFIPNLFRISDTKKSNICDSIPVFPMLPTSSLSDKIHIAVFFTFSKFIIAANDVYAHTLSSCPYAATILSSNPNDLALKAGTNSNSALNKSDSVIPYFRFNKCNIFNFTFSLTLHCFLLFSPSSLLQHENGMLPIRSFKSSPSTPFFSFFSIWSCAKCGSKSVIVNIGSVSFSPISISIFSPFVLTITPCILNGIVVH